MPHKLSDLNDSQTLPLRLLQIGDTGVGKSYRAADATRWGKVYVFDFDGKINLLCRTLKAEQKPLIEFDHYTNTTAALSFAESLLKNNPYTTIIVDTISVFNDMAEEEAKRRFNTPLDGKLGYEGWDYIRNICNMFYFGFLHKLTCNVIVNCHIEKSKDIEGKEVLSPAGRGGFIGSLPRRMTDTQYLTFAMGKFLIKPKKSDKIATNSYVDPSSIDAAGNLKVNDLSVFDKWAVKAK